MMMGSSLLIGLGALEKRLDCLLLRSGVQSVEAFSIDSIDSIAEVVKQYFKGYDLNFEMEIIHYGGMQQTKSKLAARLLHGYHRLLPLPPPHFRCPA